VQWPRLNAPLTLALWLLAGSAFGHEVAVPRFDFTPPAPGSYRLERIIQAPDGPVLDVDGRTQPLSRFTLGRITLLSFVYTTCKDPSGCPLAYHVMEQLERAIAADPALAGKVRFVTLSFDPARDTPKTMKLYGGSHVRKTDGVEWYFLTTRSVKSLRPILAGFGQDVAPAADPALGAYSHVLKVFLIDGQGWVREIYSTSFLHEATMLNDLRTLVLEQQAPR
jgi:protein SCO1